MKRLLLIVVLLFLCLPLWGADLFMDTLPEYRHAIRQALGMDTASSAIDTTTLDQFIREAVYHVNPLVKFRQREFTFATTYKNGKYVLDTLISGIISVEWFNLDSVKTLVFAPRYAWYGLPTKRTADEPEAYSRRPSYYDNTDSLIFLYPIPIKAGDSIRILSWTKLPDFASKDTLEIIPIEYRDVVLKYATYLTARSRQHPLTTLFYQEYQETVNNLNRAYGRPNEKAVSPTTNP